MKNIFIIIVILFTTTACEKLYDKTKKGIFCSENVQNVVQMKIDASKFLTYAAREYAQLLIKLLNKN